MTSFAKDGSLSSRVYLEFVRARPCHFCGASPRSQAHHWPPRSRGVIDDTKTIPVCIECHQRCEGIRVAGRRGGEPIAPAAQVAAADAVLRQFWRQAGKSLRLRVLRDIERWSESRVFTVPA